MSDDAAAAAAAGEVQNGRVNEIVRTELAETDAEKGLLLGEWVLVANLHGWDGQGFPVSQLVTVVSDSPTSRLLGLLDFARTEMKGHILGLSALDDER